jgi:hypothetical protein
MSKIGKIGRGLFGVAVLGALTLGATQALATPRPDAAVRNTCSFWDCYQSCLELWYDRGRCIGEPPYQACECYYVSNTEPG